MRLQDPVHPDHPVSHLTDIMFQYAIAYAQRSYLLGVAVGRAMFGA
jgi:hypothetical protein